MRDAAHDIWAILGIAPTRVERDIKRAYARLLKSVRPEDDPEGFQRLRDAFEAALEFAHSGEWPEPEAAVQLCMHPPLAHHDPLADARLVWDDFIAPKQNWPKVNPVQELRTVLASDALIDLETRDAFEFLAARYCASSIADRDMREMLVQFFGWSDSVAHLVRHDEQTARMALGRDRADRTHEHLVRQPDPYGVVKAVLAERHPRFAWRLADKRFAEDMLALLSTIRWQWQDLEHFRLNASVIEWWVEHVNAKRYYLQSARDSALAGVLLFLVTGHAGMAHFLVCQLVGFALLAAWIFRWREAFHAWDNRERRLVALLGAVRPRIDVQYGWLLALFLLSMFSFVPGQHRWVQLAIMDGLALTALAGLFAVSIDFSFASLITILIAGFGGGMIFADTEAFGLFSGACCATGIILQTLRGSQSLFPPAALARLPALRAGWMVTALLLAYNAVAGGLQPGAATALAFGWAVAGSVITKIRITAAYLLAGLTLMFYGLREVVQAAAPTDLAVALTFMTVMLVCMLGNAYRARQHGHQFS